jgi:acyl-CoA thioesterase I
VSLTLFICTFAPAAIANGTIVVFGDSLSAGYGLPREQAWPSLLAERLRGENLDYRVVNASISGETTTGGRNRIEHVLAEHRPAVVIVALGANDGLRGSALDAVRANLEAIIDACRRAGSRVLLVGMRLPPNYGRTYVDRFHEAFGEVAASRKTAFVPFLLEGFAEEQRYFLDDGIHPTADAQPLVLDIIWKGLLPLLHKPRPAARSAPPAPARGRSTAPYFTTTRGSPLVNEPITVA